MILSSNKKATLQDMFFLAVLFVATITTIVVGMKVFSSYKDSEIFTGSVESEQVKTDIQNLNNLWDYVFITIFFLGSLTAVISAFLTGSHPIFFWGSIILAMILIVIGVIFNNYYDSFVNTEQLVEVKDSLPMTTFVFDHFGKFLIGFIMLISIALYFPTRGGAGG